MILGSTKPLIPRSASSGPREQRRNIPYVTDVSAEKSFAGSRKPCPIGVCSEVAQLLILITSDPTLNLTLTTLCTELHSEHQLQSTVCPAAKKLAMQSDSENILINFRSGDFGNLFSPWTLSLTLVPSYRCISNSSLETWKNYTSGPEL